MSIECHEIEKSTYHNFLQVAVTSSEKNPKLKDIMFTMRGKRVKQQMLKFEELEWMNVGHLSSINQFNEYSIMTNLIFRSINLLIVSAQIPIELLMYLLVSNLNSFFSEDKRQLVNLVICN